MKKAYLFLAEGFEEAEGLVTVDLLRRGGVDLVTVSMGDSLQVTGRSRISVLADRMYQAGAYGDADALILPGGQPGVSNLKKSRDLAEDLRKAAGEGKVLAAVCAGPTVLGQLGLLRGHMATCYPGCEGELEGASLSEEPVVRSGQVITSRGVGTTIPFALAILEALTDREAAEKVAASIVYRA